MKFILESMFSLASLLNIETIKYQNPYDIIMTQAFTRPNKESILDIGSFLKSVNETHLDRNILLKHERELGITSKLSRRFWVVNRRLSFEVTPYIFYLILFSSTKWRWSGNCPLNLSTLTLLPCIRVRWYRPKFCINMTTKDACTPIKKQRVKKKKKEILE